MYRLTWLLNGRPLLRRLTVSLVSFGEIETSKLVAG